MRINEVIKKQQIPMDFVNKIRTLLGTTQFEMPKIESINRTENGELGGCNWKPGQKYVTIDFDKSVLKDRKTTERVLAHELCHEAEYLLDYQKELADEKVKALKLVKNVETDGPIALAYYREFLANLVIRMKMLQHGKTWQKYANKINAIYGKNFVTKTSDETYILEK